MKLELSAGGVIRAAAWPLEALAPFGATDPETERRELWERTAADPRFLRALLLASPSLYERALKYAGRRHQRVKRVRHAETSLYRYLARAATRTTPSGLFAGVAGFEFGETDRIEPCVPRLHVALDLEPFARALFALGQTERYRASGRYRLNPTLARLPDGGFSFFARRYGGEVELRRLEGGRVIEGFLSALAGAPADEIDALARSTRVPRSVLVDLAAGGVLVGGLALPGRFASADEALERVSAWLSSEHRTAWRDGLQALSRLCREIASTFDLVAADRLAKLLDEGKRLLSSLFEKLGVAVRLPEVVFRCDLGLGFRVVLGADRRRELETALDEYQRAWLDGLSPASASRRLRRRARRDRVASGSSGPGHLAAVDAALDEAAIAAFRAAITAGDERVISGKTGAPDPAGGAPWGCVFARLGDRRVTALFGVDDNPLRAFARHGALLDESAAVRWVNERFEALRAQHGVVPVDLVVPFESNPSALARLDTRTVALEPWGPDGPSCAGARLRADGDAVLLDLPGVGPSTVLSLCSAAVLGGDPVAEWFAAAGYDESVGASFRAALLVDPVELEAPRFTARLTLADGTVVRPRRTCLAGSELSRLAGHERARRVVEFQKLGDRLGWPAHVSLSVDGGTPLFVPTASPLAIEAALEGLGNARLVTIEEAEPSAWLEGRDGRYVADLAVPFARTPHAYSHLAAAHAEERSAAR